MAYSDSTGYSRLQILLHWAVVGLLILQLATSDAIEDTHDAVERGRIPDSGDLFLHSVHIYSGLTILALVLIRIALRRRYGAPALPESLPALAHFAASATHLGLYLLLIALPVTGALKVWVFSDAGDVHEALTVVLWALVGAHVAAALMHAVVLRDGVFSRMLRPAR